MNKKQKVLVAMSGGVDSTVAALLLQKKGYDVIGITMKTWDYSNTATTTNKETGCCNLDSFNDARSAAVQHGFPHYVLDLREEFSEAVVDDFIKTYMSGATPNPCIQCNTFIKWKALLAKADTLGCDYIATGHYAKIFHHDSRYFISRAKDLNKDQSYVLWGLNQEVLRRTLFPLHNLLKPEVRKIAKDFGLEDLSKKKESYEICFIPDNDYRNFLKNKVENFEEKVSQGNFLDVKGNVIGKHNGFPFFTIGQRKKLGTAFGKPMYVSDINSNTNTVTLGEENDLFQSEITLSKVNMMKYQEVHGEQEYLTKIRYNSESKKSLVKMMDGKIHIMFPQQIKAPSPGQSAVFYEGNDVVGGGFILKKMI